MEVKKIGVTQFNHYGDENTKVELIKTKDGKYTAVIYHCYGDEVEDSVSFDEYSTLKELEDAFWENGYEITINIQ